VDLTTASVSRADGAVGSIVPAQTEWVPGGVRVHPVSGGRSVVHPVWLMEQASAGVDRLSVCRCDVVDRQVEVNLLRLTVRPLRRHVLWRQLHGYGGSTIHCQDVVSVALLQFTTEQSVPEPTLILQVGGIENDSSERHLHTPILPARCSVRHTSGLALTRRDGRAREPVQTRNLCTARHMRSMRRRPDHPVA
jgi:hypothetical protein